MNWPEQKVVARLTAQYATKLKQAFKSAIDGDAIARSWAETHPAGGSVYRKWLEIGHWHTL